MSNEPKPSSPGVYYLDIDDSHAGQRIDNFLLSKLKGVPKSRIYRLLRRGEVRVNRSRVKAEYRLQMGDHVRIPPVRVSQQQDSPGVSDSLAASLEGSILYEDDSLLVVNKPSGLAVHGGSGIKLGLIEALRVMRADCRFLELVHRLDRDTSGCVMVAKKRSMLRYLHQQLQSDGVDKRYLALVAGRWPKRRQLVSARLQKNSLQSGERVVRVMPEGKKSLTEFQVKRRFADATLIEAKPITGRTHQIRVHCQYAGHAIVGDDKYAQKADEAHFKAQGSSRLFLHAATLSVAKPESDQRYYFEAPLPSELKHFLTQLAADETSQ